MAQVIRDPKDGIDEMIERCRSIDGVLAGKVQTPAVRDARDHLQAARDDLVKARDAVSRSLAGRRAAV